MVPTSGFNFKQAVEMQSVCRKGFTTGFVWIENRSLCCLGNGKPESSVKIQPPVITYGRFLDLLNKEFCPQSDSAS